MSMSPGLLASDLNNKDFVGAVNPDEALHVRFFKRHPKGDPRQERTDYVEIKAHEYLSVIREVTDADKRRFPNHWKLYTEKGEGITHGTPLANWAILSQEQVLMLNSVGFFTVEQVAAAGDQQIAGIGMHGGMAPQSFRMQAKRFLSAQKGEEAAAEISAKEESLRKELDAAKARDAARDKEMAEMRAMLAQLTAPPKNETLTVSGKAKA